MAADQDQTEHPGRRLFAMPCEFVASAPRPEALPAAGLPEVAAPAARNDVGSACQLARAAGRQRWEADSIVPGAAALLPRSLPVL